MGLNSNIHYKIIVEDFNFSVFTFQNCFKI